MSVELKFGFGSFGDIVTIIDLGWKLAQLLSSMRGFDRSYQTLVDEVNLVREFLQDTEPLLRSRSNNQLQRATENAIKHLVKQCATLMEEINAKAEYTKRRLNSEGSWSYFVAQPLDLWRRAGWKVLGPATIAAWTEQLRDVRRSITNLLLYSNHFAVNQQGLEQVQQGTKLAAIETGVNILLERLYSYDSVRNETQIRFVDLQNITVLFPAEFCLTMQMFQRYMEVYFETHPGRSFFDRGDYYFVQSDTEESKLKPVDWQERVKPGSTVKMNAIIRTSLSSLHRRPRCPACGLPPLLEDLAFIEPKTMKCNSCQTSFKALKVGLATRAPSLPSAPARKLLLTVRLSDNVEMHLLRRFHIARVV